MKIAPLNGLLIRTAVVFSPDAGYIFTCDPKKMDEDIPHTIIFRWKAGAFNSVECNYNAHSVCLIEHPDLGLLNASEQGYYSVETRNGVIGGDIIDDSLPRPSQPRFGGIRSVSMIAGKAYAVGLRGMVYRLDSLERWTRIDDGLPEVFNIQAIHGFNASDLYAVGRDGDVWHFDGNKWDKNEVPTNVNLTAVKCTENEKVYIGGHNGILIQGRGSSWTMIDHGETKDDIWDIEWFEGNVYISTMNTVYRLNSERFEPVNFGDDPPKSCYQLSIAKGVMWSIGEVDIMSFNGKEWTRIV